MREIAIRGLSRKEMADTLAGRVVLSLGASKRKMRRGDAWVFSPPPRESGETQRQYASRCEAIEKRLRKERRANRCKRASWGPNRWKAAS